MRKKIASIYIKIRDFANRIARNLGLILPMKKNAILFTSLAGQYSDSPKAISERIHLIAPDIRQIWATNRTDLPSYVQCVKYNSLRHNMYMGKIGAWVDNFYCGGRMVRVGDQHKVCFRKGQKQFTTFHGYAFKRIGRDVPGGENIVDFQCGNLTMFAGSQHSLEVMDHVTFNRVNMVLTGLPRNDALILRAEDAEMINSLKKKLKLPMDKRIALYAPTFRSDVGEDSKRNVNRSGLDQLNDLDVKLLLKKLSEKFGGEWVLACRLHQYVRRAVDLSKYNGQVIDANIGQDMVEYLQCVDMLISDASSCMFDYVLTKKPVFMYFPDIDAYVKNERGGFYYPYQKLPFALATSGNELIKCIGDFDQDEYLLRVERLMQEMGYNEDGSATDRCAKYIIETVRKLSDS